MGLTADGHSQSVVVTFVWEILQDWGGIKESFGSNDSGRENMDRTVILTNAHRGIAVPLGIV